MTGYSATFLIKWYLLNVNAMNLKRNFLPFLALLFFSCSSDDSDNPVQEEETEISASSFTVIGQDLENVYQFDYDASSDQGQLTNLTLEFNINRDYLTLREVEDLLSFYYFAGGAFSLFTKDVRTGESTVYTDFFSNNPGQSVAWGINSKSNVYFGFFGPFGERNLGILDVEFVGDLGQDVAIDEDVDFVFQPLLFQNKIYFVYRNNQGEYKFTFYDTLNRTAGEILDFGNVPISFLFDEFGELAIVKNGADATLEFYDANSLEFLESRDLNFNTAFSPGPVDGAVIKGNTLYYAFPYVQPAKFSAGPASFDLSAQENTVIDFLSIASEVEQELGQSIGLTVQIYDAREDIFFVAYEVLDQSARGGILQIGATGELVSNVATTFVPTYIVRN